jgi:hypothetical protein
MEGVLGGSLDFFLLTVSPEKRKTSGTKAP